MARSGFIVAVLSWLALCVSSPAYAQDGAAALGGDSGVGDEALYIDGDGDDPWPEMTASRTVRKVARRLQGDREPQSDVDGDQPDNDGPSMPLDGDIEAVDPIEDYEVALDHDVYLESLEYVDDTGVKPPPGMLVVSNTGSIRKVRARGGDRVGAFGAPWQAQIYFPKVANAFKPMLAAKVPLWALQHYCGGALVADNWVITAAHCIDESMRQAGYKVRLGQKNLNNGAGWTYSIVRVVRYAPYAPRKGGDLALIQIASDTGVNPPDSQVRPIALFRGGDVPKGRSINVYGWGRQSDGGMRTNQILLSIGLEVMDRNLCSPQGKRLGWAVVPSILCATAPPDTDRKSCAGDSGGAVVDAITKQLVAVVSGGGPKCAKDNDPSFYTRIGAYLNWITQVTKGDVR